MIPTELLKQYDAQTLNLDKDVIIFEQDSRADYFNQIITGQVAMVTTNEDGKEFTQGMFSDGESFGDPVLFLELPYPSTAIALTETTVIRLYKDSFFQLLKENPEVLLNITRHLSELLHFKTKMATEISLYSPEHRILTLLQHIKLSDEPERIDLTRQQIANLTALRVETVIRAIKSLEEDGKLQIIDRKVYL